jgi:hypothetical protein
LVADAGVEEHVLHQVRAQRRPAEHVGEPAVSAPVIGHGTAVGDHALNVGTMTGTNLRPRFGGRASASGPLP